MKINKQKFILLLFCGSILLNVVLLSVVGYKLYWRYYIRTHGDRNFMRAEVFEKMPNSMGKIIFLGDSHTDHFEVSELFENATILNRGISGNTSSDVMDRLPEVINRKPAKVFIMLGINDFTYGITEEVIVNNYRQIIHSIKKYSPATKIYFQSILPHYWTNSKIKSTNKALELLCKQEQIAYIDLFTAFESNGALNKKYDCGDGVHLNGDGYLLWRDMIITYVKE